MTTYITSYIIGSLLLLLIINLFLRKKKTVAKPDSVIEDAKRENDIPSSLEKADMVEPVKPSKEVDKVWKISKGDGNE